MIYVNGVHRAVKWSQCSCIFLLYSCRKKKLVDWWPILMYKFDLHHFQNNLSTFWFETVLFKGQENIAQFRRTAINLVNSVIVLSKKVSVTASQYKTCFVWHVPLRKGFFGFLTMWRRTTSPFVLLISCSSAMSFGQHLTAAKHPISWPPPPCKWGTPTNCYYVLNKLRETRKLFWCLVYSGKLLVKRFLHRVLCF